eukprot:7315857-Prymnesium_polylepis.1
MPACTIGRSKKQAPPTRTTGGGGSPRRSGLHLPAHPASCWRFWPATSAASRTACPPQVQHIARRGSCRS